MAWRLSGCGYLKDTNDGLYAGLRNAEICLKEFASGCIYAENMRRVPDRCSRGVWNELVVSFNAFSQNVLAFFCTDLAMERASNSVGQMARKKVLRARNLYRDAFLRNPPLLVLRTHDIQEHADGPFMTEQDYANLQYRAHASQMQVFVALVATSVAVGLMASNLNFHQITSCSWDSMLAGCLYALTYSYQGIACEVYKYMNPGGNGFQFRESIIVTCSRLLAWAFGLAYIYKSKGFEGLCLSLNPRCILRYAAPGLFFVAYEVLRLSCMSVESATLLQVVLMLGTVPLAIARCLLFRVTYSCSQWSSLIIMIVAGLVRSHFGSSLGDSYFVGVP